MSTMTPPRLPDALPGNADARALAALEGLARRGYDVTRRPTGFVVMISVSSGQGGTNYRRGVGPTLAEAAAKALAAAGLLPAKGAA